MARLIRGLVRSAVVAKVFQVVRHQLAKPENQRRIKELVNRATARGSQRAKPGRAAA